MIHLEKTPFFRKAFIPWYASNTVCLIKTVVMLGISLFGLRGIMVARKSDAVIGDVWVPALVLIFSMIVMIINLARVIQRYADKSPSGKSGS